MNAGKAVYGILSANSTVTNIVSTRIFPEIAEQEAATPFVVYQLQSVDPEDTHDGPSKLDEVRFEFMCYADTYNEAADLATAVRGALDRVSGTYNGVNIESVQFNDVDTEVLYDPRRYSQVLTFTFRVKRDDIEIALGTPVTGAVLNDLSDVNVTGVTDNQILSYDAATDSWVAADDAGGLVDSVNGQTGTVTLGLDDLTDVDAGAPTAGQLLAYGQGDWTTISQDEITIGIENVTGLQAELNTIPANIRDLDDVTIAGPTSNQLLQYNGTAWVNANLNVAQSLDDLTDVDIADQPANGALLQYNSNLQLWQDSGSNRLPTDGVYYHDRYQSTAASLRAGATATTELYYTAQADGDGYAESASSDTPTTGYDIQRKLYYSEAAFADPDTGTWVQFAAIADNTTFANAKAALLAYLKERTGGTVPISLKQTWQEVLEPAFLLDTYTGAAAAYSLRQLRTAYTGSAIRVRRASDNTEQDIGFDGSGELDTTSLASFCSGTNGFVAKWYDQSGNANDATQTTAANQPKIYDSVTGVITENGKPTVDFVAHYLIASWDIGTAVSCAIVCADVGIYDFITGNTNLNVGFLVQSRNNISFWISGLDAANSVSVNPASQQVLISGAFDSTNQKMYANALSTIRTESRSFNGAGLGFRIGYVDNAAGAVLTGKIQEIIYWNSYIPNDITSIHTAINTFYSIY